MIKFNRGVSFVILILIITTGCVYDPPMKGKEIIFENQSNGYLYVSDSILSNLSLNIYDTFIVNNVEFISRVPNYIPKYSKWNFFLSKKRYEMLIANNIKKIEFLFIDENNIMKTKEQIIKEKLYKTFTLNLNTFVSNEINEIFYYKDSIVLHNYFNLVAKH